MTTGRDVQEITVYLSEEKVIEIQILKTFTIVKLPTDDYRMGSFGDLIM